LSVVYSEPVDSGCGIALRCSDPAVRQRVRAALHGDDRAIGLGVLDLDSLELSVALNHEVVVTVLAIRNRQLATAPEQVAGNHQLREISLFL